MNPRDPDFLNTPASPLRPRFAYSPEDSAAPPAVSIITPFYNTGGVFHETATSVFRQSLQQWEWIIVDDCTNDPHSIRILDDYRAKDPRVRIIRTPNNLGLPGARNAGARVATAEFLMLLDSDDLLEPTALEKLSWFLDVRPQLGFAKGYTVGFAAQNYLWNHGFHNPVRFLSENQVTATAMIRSSVYRSVGGMEAERRQGMEDWEFWLKCAANGIWGDTVPEYFDWYRRRENHGDRWPTLDKADPDPASSFRQEMRSRYPALFETGIGHPRREPFRSYPVLNSRAPYENVLECQGDVKRLLMVLPHLELGGADKFNLDLIQSLQTDHGYEVTVVSTLGGEQRWRHEFENLTPDVFVLDTFLPVPEFPRFIEYLIRSRRPDIVLVTNSQMGYQLLPFLRAGCPGPVYADYVHMEQEEWRSGGYPRYSLNYAPFLDFTVTTSEHLRQWMIHRGGDPARIYVCTINVDSAMWDRARYDQHSLRLKYEITPATPVISYAARLTDQKQPDVMAEVIKRVRDAGLEFVCLVAGDGPYREHLEDFQRRNALGELRLLGALPNAEIREILAIADIYFMPSKMEGIALALYEAMSMGVVPVAADVGGQRELVPAECGVLVEHGPNEIEEYTRVLVELLADVPKRREMMLECRKRICERFELRQMGHNMAGLFSEALQKSVSSAFDLRTAFETWRHSLAAEIVEQRRFEVVADELWAFKMATLQAKEAAKRADTLSATERAFIEDEAARAVLNAISEAREPQEEYVAALGITGRVFHGNIFLFPRLLRLSGVSYRGFFRTLMLVLSPLDCVSKFRNLRLLAKVLSNQAARAKLLESFDAVYYRSRYEDVRNSEVIPLVHYCLAGHLEDRVPSVHSDAAEILRSDPDLIRRKINPVLWSALHSEGWPR